MPGLVPGIQRREAARRYQNFNALLGARRRYRLGTCDARPDVDGRHKAGHDGTLSFSRPILASPAFFSAYGDKPGHDGGGRENLGPVREVAFSVQARMRNFRISTVNAISAFFVVAS